MSGWLISTKFNCHAANSTLRRINLWITKNVRSEFYKHGLRVGRHPWFFLFAPVLVTAIFCLGILRFKCDQEIRYLFTPTDALSHKEFDKLQYYLNDEGGLYNLDLFVQAKDNGSLLRDGYPGRVLSLINFLYNNFTVHDPVLNTSLKFSDLQINHKQDMELITSLLGMLDVAPAMVRSHLRYPVTTTPDGEQLYIGNVLSSVSTHPISRVVTGVKTIALHFRSACGDKEHCDKLKRWTQQFLDPLSVHNDDYLTIYPWNDYLMTVELLRVSQIIVPYVLLSFGVLVVFAVCASFTHSALTSKPWEAVAGVVSVGLAVASSFGVIFGVGFSFVGTLSVMPVLALALGLDVTFIVLRNWQSTNPELDPVERLAETWAESGTSVVITSLTNVMSTIVGTITNVPAIQTFCLSTTVAVLFLFFYQITFFAAAIALGSRREAASRHACFLWPMKDASSNSIPSTTPDVQQRSRVHSLLAKAASTLNLCNPVVGRTPRAASSRAKGHTVVARVLNDDWWHRASGRLANLLCNPYSRLAVICCLVVYWITAIWGCLHLELGLTPEKLFLPDSILMKSIGIEKRNLLLNVFVQNPPDFTNDRQSNRFYQLVNELEAIPECLGPESTSLWLRPYEKHLEFMESNRSEEFYPSIGPFLQISQAARWRSYIDVDYNETTGDSTLKKFFFSVAYKRQRSWTERIYYTRLFRSIVENYADFNVTIYCDDNNNFVIDQLEAIPINTVQDVLTTGFCMAIICLLFIPNFFNTLCAMATIFSINIGVFGYLVFWDVNLDPVSMTSLLLSIGYSVDFTSHISFHYYSSPGADQQHKLTAALSSIGLPMIETGFSTVLSVGCLCLVDSYLVWVYFKTTLLVVLLGLMHGLLVLPTFLAWLPIDAWDWIYADGQGNPRKSADGGVAGTLPPKSPNPDVVQIALGQIELNKASDHT